MCVQPLLPENTQFMIGSSGLVVIRHSISTKSQCYHCQGLGQMFPGSRLTQRIESKGLHRFAKEAR